MKKRKLYILMSCLIVATYVVSYLVFVRTGMIERLPRAFSNDPFARSRLAYISDLAYFPLIKIDVYLIKRPELYARAAGQWTTDDGLDFVAISSNGDYTMSIAGIESEGALEGILHKDVLRKSDFFLGQFSHEDIDYKYRANLQSSSDDPGANEQLVFWLSSLDNTYFLERRLTKVEQAAP